MSKRFERKDFLIKDLAVSIGAGGNGSTWLPVDEDNTPPPTMSPIASVLANVGLIEAVRGTVVEATKAKRFEEIAQAFIPGEAGGSPVIRAAIQEIGSAVVASAAFAAVTAGNGGGKVGLIDPSCGGTSTIPTPITPWVHRGLAIHKISELPRLKKQLAEAVAYVDRAVAAQTPQGAEVGAVRAQLEVAMKALG